MSRSLSLLLILLLLAGVVLTGCGAGETAVGHDHPMAPVAEMPTDVQYAPFRVQEAYRFAVANPEVADAIPCYCGCVGMGHTSSYDCYVAGVDENGVVQFDDHALSCAICTDITQDTMQMMDDGKSTAEIRAQIDADYAKFAPPTVKPAGASS